jgi:hypothetical protein
MFTTFSNRHPERPGPPPAAFAGGVERERSTVCRDQEERIHDPTPLDFGQVAQFRVPPLDANLGVHLTALPT